MIFTHEGELSDEPRKVRESLHQFYARSASPHAVQMRQYLKRFLEHYPEQLSKQIVSRLTSGKETDFSSAAFELFLHESLWTRGCQIEVETELRNGKRPDFLVTTPSSERFYLEAVLTADQTESNAASEVIKSEVMEYLSGNPHPFFAIEITSDGEPETQPSAKNLVKKVHAWLGQFNPDDFLPFGSKLGPEPLEWRHENWQLLIEAVALPPENRGTNTDFIYCYGDLRGEMINSWQPIKRAVVAKAKKYKIDDLPLIVAVNHRGFHLDLKDEMQALFGQEQYHINRNAPAAPPLISRVPNGIWHGNNQGWQYRNLSAVWLFGNIDYSEPSHKRNTVYFNPCATLPAPDFLKRFNHAVAVDGKMDHRLGEPVLLG